MLKNIKNLFYTSNHVQNKTNLIIFQNFSTKRKPLTALKNVLFEKHKDNFNYVNCCICTKKLEYRHMNIGHFISLKNGGTNTVDNLRPICQGCNCSIGSLNVNDFLISYGIVKN